MQIPNLLLKKLYTEGSLRNTNVGAQFSLKNRLTDAELVAVSGLFIDGHAVPMEQVRLDVAEDRVLTAAEVDSTHPIPFPLRSTVTVQTGEPDLTRGKHQIEIAFEARPFGNLKLKVEDSISDEADRRIRLPRNEDDDYSTDVIRARKELIEKTAGVKLKHLLNYSFDPHALAGNCENFVGVAQVPIGFAGPLLVNGEHANGEFMIPMATTEGTMIASYNRGMKLLNLAGGVKATVSADSMQRAPAFIFGDARQARAFEQWVKVNIGEIRAVAEATSSIAKLLHIESFSASKFVYLRFNYSTGDAAGQNMVGRATLAACQWILEHAEGIEDFFLESNFATDKKDSYINRMRTRGKRVTAEATIPGDFIRQIVRVDPQKLLRHQGVGNLGALLSGANNNGLQSANGIAAVFIATGQDVADVAESSSALVYAEVMPNGDFYVSITIPSLIVATHGGGTGLPTQRECLDVLGCCGKGKVNKLAEIVGAVVLAGEVSLAAAISSNDWVSSHEKFGRNR